MRDVYGYRSPSLLAVWFNTLAEYRRDIAVVFAALLAAVIFGLVSTTGQPLLIAVAAGLFFGVYLFSNPQITLWLILGGGLFVAGLVPIWAEGIGSKAVWAISLLGLILMATSIIRLIVEKNTADQTPVFVWIALLFMLYCLINGAIQSDLYELFSGFKRYFQVIGICFAFAWLGFSQAELKKWFWLMALLLLMQLPFALYERITLVPMRESIQYAYPGMIPIDVVAGTFGASRYSGGANAELATFLIISLAFLVSRHRLKLLSAKTFAALTAFAFIPLFLGETKIVIVFLPVMFCVLYRKDLLTKPLILVLALVVGSLLTLAVTYTYLQMMQASTVSEMIRSIAEYNFQDKGYGGLYLNRMTALIHWIHEQGMHNPASFVFGNGLGTAHDSTGGTIAVKYLGYGVGLTTLSTLLWEQGLVGSFLFYMILINAWFVAGKLMKSCDDWIRADAAAIQCALALFMIYPIYRSTMLEGLPFQILIWSLLGYLCWLAKREAA